MTEKLAVGIREFGRMVGRSHVWVLNQCKAGKLPRDANGQIPVGKGIEACKKLGIAIGSSSKDIALNVALKEAKLATEEANARLKELEFKQRNGELVSVTEVEADAQQVAERLRSFCMAAPSRYSGLMADRSKREVEDVLRTLFSEFWASVSKSRFVHGVTKEC